MNTKRILSFIAGCMLSIAISTSSVFAKEIPAAKEKGPVLFNTERIANALNLNPEQTIKLEKILATIQTRIESKRSERPRSRRDIQSRREFDSTPMARGPHNRLDREERRGPRGMRFEKDRHEERGEFTRGERGTKDRRELAVGRREFDEKPMRHGPRVRGERGDKHGPRGTRLGKSHPRRRGEFMRGERGRENRREIAMAQLGRDDVRNSRRRLHRGEGLQRRDTRNWNRNAGPRGPVPWMNLTDDQRERIRDIIMENPEKLREDVVREKSESRREILKRMRERANRDSREFRPIGRQNVRGFHSVPGDAERGRGFRPFDKDDSSERNDR